MMSGSGETTATSAASLVCSPIICIAANVIRALDHLDFEGAAQRARALLEREFAYLGVLKRWKEAQEDVCGGG